MWHPRFLERPMSIARLQASSGHPVLWKEELEPHRIFFGSDVEKARSFKEVLPNLETDLKL